MVGGIAHLFGAEIESATGFRFVIDADVGFFADGNGWVEGEDDFGIGEVVAETGFGTSGAHDIEFNRVETEFCQWGCDGFESQDDISLNGAFFEVGGDVEFEVENIDFAVGRVFAVCGGIGAGCGGCEGAVAAGQRVGLGEVFSVDGMQLEQRAEEKDGNDGGDGSTHGVTLCRIVGLDNGRRVSAVGLAVRGATGKVGR